jgi:hypothetical protein
MERRYARHFLSSCSTLLGLEHKVRAGSALSDPIHTRREIVCVCRRMRRRRGLGALQQAARNGRASTLRRRACAATRCACLRVRRRAARGACAG